MSHFVSFSAEPESAVDTLVMNLLDPMTDAGSISHLISNQLKELDERVAAQFDVDPLTDYRAVHPAMHYHEGQLVAMARSGMVLSFARDMEGREFLRLHGSEPDFSWDALASDMVDVIDHFHITRIFSLSSFGAPATHTRPAEMTVRSSDPNVGATPMPADFWFSGGFADYFEYLLSGGDVATTNVAVRVPFYMARHTFASGASAALGMLSHVTGLSFPVGDLQERAAEEDEALNQLVEQNEQLGEIIEHIEHDYDARGSMPGFVPAPPNEFEIPSVDEIGRAAEQFLASVDTHDEGMRAHTAYDPRGLMDRIRSLGGRRGTTDLGYRPFETEKSHTAAGATPVWRSPREDPENAEDRDEAVTGADSAGSSASESETTQGEATRKAAAQGSRPMHESPVQKSEDEQASGGTPSPRPHGRHRRQRSDENPS
ncbi:MAG: PAC2 family protein [Actinomycetaceae bacterium]|nr:PAC2 family protein [Actinomycetaceae bacterium]MDY6083025.1 PAC2 family protein [Actinomycetaceae bacterium]